MAYSKHLADRIRARLKGIHYFEKTMMIGLIFMVLDAMCFGLDFDKKMQRRQIDGACWETKLREFVAPKWKHNNGLYRTSNVRILFIKASGFNFEERLDFWFEKGLEFNLLLTQT